MTLGDILRWPGRERTRRGFGVHSPFAFDFITNTLRGGRARYYGYRAVEALPLPPEWGRRLFRIMVRLNPQSLCYFGSNPGPYREIARQAIPSATFNREARMVIVDDFVADELPSLRVALLRAQARGATLIFTDLRTPASLSLWRQILMVTPRGMSFHDTRTGILVADPKLPRQDFDLNL